MTELLARIPAVLDLSSTNAFEFYKTRSDVHSFMTDSPSRPISTAPDDTLRQDAESSDRSARLSRRKLRPPGDVPGYKINLCLGEGAYGSVWLAGEQNTGKQVAIKFYTHRGGLDWSLLNREVEKLAMLYTSRDIVRLYEVGWDAQPPYYVMEYLENGSLAALLREGPLSVTESVRIAEAVLRALVHAHGSGILHCDIKPANVLLDGDMQPRLADFGQSRLSNSQDPALGTLFYMAPDQADLAAVPDARWDVYALGALLYHCLCGHPPFRTPEVEQKILAADNLRERLAIYRGTLQTAERPSAHRRVAGVDKRLVHIVDRCLEMNPARRYPNAQAALEAFKVRAKQRARRPAIVMGIIAPLLLLIALVPLGFQAGDQAVATSESAVVFQASENNKLAAKATARMLESELVGLIGQLHGAASNPELAEAIYREGELPQDKRSQLEELLINFRRRYSVPRTLKARSRTTVAEDDEIDYLLDRSWFLTNAQGVQLWRDPHGETIDGEYHWRDYFHWGGKQLPKTVDIKDVKTHWDEKTFHISSPFVSEETKNYMVAISVVVRDKESSQPLGVLARTIDLGKLLSEKTLGGVRRVAMIDGRNGKFLDHPLMSPSRFEGLDDDEVTATIEDLELSPAMREKLAEYRHSRDQTQDAGEMDVIIENQHRDPADRLDPEAVKRGDGQQRWLAAFARVPGTDWWTVAQERHTEAIQPVQKVQSELTFYGMIGLSAFFALIGALWYFLLRGVSNRTVRLGLSRSRRGRNTETEALSGSGRSSSFD